MQSPEIRDFVIVLDHVHKRRGSNVVLDDFCLNVPSNIVMGLLGESGAGKSTVLAMVAGLQRPDRGKIRILGAQPRQSRLIGPIGAYIGGSNFVPQYGVGQYFRFLASLMRLPDPQGAVDTMLDCVGGLSWKLRRFGDLSVEAHYLLGLAQTFLGSPRVLLIDEPSRRPSDDAVRSIRRLIRNRNGTITAIVTSRHVEYLELLCDELSVMRSGSVDSTCKVSDLWRGELTCLIELETVNVPESVIPNELGFGSIRFDRDSQTLTVTADSAQFTFEKVVELVARELGERSIAIRSVKRLPFIR